MSNMPGMENDPHSPKRPRPFTPTEFQPTQPEQPRAPLPQPTKPRVDLDALEQKLLTLREEMRLLHARLETLNLFTRLGVRPGQKPSSR